MQQMDGILSTFTDRAKKAMHVATAHAASCGRPHAGPEDVLWAIATIEIGPGRAALERLGINIADCADQIESLPVDSANEPDQIIRQAHSHAEVLRHRYLGTEHLTLAIATSGKSAAAYLGERGVSADNLICKVKEVLGCNE